MRSRRGRICRFASPSASMWRSLRPSWAIARPVSSTASSTGSRARCGPTNSEAAQVGSAKRPGEFELIRRYFAPLAAATPAALGLGDDVAILTPRAGHELVITTDALVASIHFFPGDPPDQIARKM